MRPLAIAIPRRKFIHVVITGESQVRTVSLAITWPRATIATKPSLRVAWTKTLEKTELVYVWYNFDRPIVLHWRNNHNFVINLWTSTGSKEVGSRGHGWARSCVPRLTCFDWGWGTWPTQGRSFGWALQGQGAGGRGGVVFRVGVFNGDQKMCVSCKDLSPLFSVQFCAQWMIQKIKQKHRRIHLAELFYILIHTVNEKLRVCVTICTYMCVHTWHSIRIPLCLSACDWVWVSVSVFLTR